MSLFVYFGLGAMLLISRYTRKPFVRQGNRRDLLIWLVYSAIGVAVSFGLLQYYHQHDPTAIGLWLLGGLAIILPDVLGLLRDAARQNVRAIGILTLLGLVVGGLVLLAQTNPDASMNIVGYAALCAVIYAIVWYSLPKKEPEKKPKRRKQRQPTR